MDRNQYIQRDIMPYTDDNGIYFTGLFDFLLKDEWQ